MNHPETNFVKQYQPGSEARVELKNGRPRSSFDVSDGVTSIGLDNIAGAGIGEILHLEIQGFIGDQLVALARREAPFF